jgi:hypothetical protein
MEWLEKILSDENITDKKDAISKELAKHFVPKDVFNEKSDKLKEKESEFEATKTQLESVIKKLPNVENEKEQLKTELDKIKADFEKFQGEAEERVLTIKKKQAVEKGLREANANPDTIDLLLEKFDYSLIEVDDNSNVKNFEKHLEPIKEQRKSLFGASKFNGGETTTGKNNEPGTYKARYDEALKKGSMLEAIKIKQEAFSKGEKIN